MAASKQDFATLHADRLAGQIGHGFKRRPAPARGWTERAVWYERDDELLAVVGEQEAAGTDHVLAHGLYLAQGRRLLLVLPKSWAWPTLHRLPWLTAEVQVWTYAAGDPIHLEPKRSQEATRAAAGDPEPSRPLRLDGARQGLVWALLEWATVHPDLDGAHTRSLRAWSCNGQRVLTVGGQKGGGLRVTAGIDASAEPAHVKEVRTPLTPAELVSIKHHVESGIGHAKAKKFGKFEEHHLQVLLRRDPSLLRLEHPVLRETPAWRPRGGEKKLGRGFIDLAGLDPAGDITLVETKLDSDDMLILQGLDYWIWATADKNHKWLADRLYADPKAHIKLLYAVAGKGGATPKIGRYERAHLTMLDAEITWRFALIENWSGSASKPIVRVLEPRELP